MDTVAYFYENVVDTLHKVATEQKENIHKAAEMIADAMEAGNSFFIFGTGGHSNMAAIEMCHRAGNLVEAHTILDPGLSCEHGATRWCERVVGYADQVMRYYRVKSGDVMLQVNAYGINPVTIDTARWCREHNVKVIAVTAPALSDMIDRKQHNRHPSGLNLYELADVVIDDYTPYGEAIVPIDGMEDKVSPASSIVNLFIVDCINAEVCQVLTHRGIPAEVWRSGNKPDGDRKNQENLDKHFGTLRHL